MHNDLLQAGCRLLGQFQIQPEAPGVRVTRPPAGLHPADAHLVVVRTERGFPFGVQSGQASAQPAAIPTLEDGFTGFTRSTRAHTQHNLAVFL